MKRIYGLMGGLGFIIMTLAGCSSSSMSDLGMAATPSSPIFSPSPAPNTPATPSPELTPVINKPFNYNDPLPENEQRYLDKCGATGCI